MPSQRERDKGIPRVPRRLRNPRVQFIILHYLGCSTGKYTVPVISYANVVTTIWELPSITHADSEALELWAWETPYLSDYSCRVWREGEEGGRLWGHQSDSDHFWGKKRKGTWDHLSPGHNVYLARPSYSHPGIPLSPHLSSRSPYNQSPSVDYINTPRGRTQTEDNGSTGGDSKRKQGPLHGQGY